MTKMKWWQNTAIALVGIGALNWGLVEFFKFNVVDSISTALNLPVLAQIVYGLVGISGIYALYWLFFGKK